MLPSETKSPQSFLTKCTEQIHFLKSQKQDRVPESTHSKTLDVVQVVPGSGAGADKPHFMSLAPLVFLDVIISSNWK